MRSPTSKREGVLLIGLGGLGAAAAATLAAGGISRLGVADPDEVDLSNLHRQTLYRTEDVGKRKGDAARDRLRKPQPRLKTALIPRSLRTPEEIAEAALP